MLIINFNKENITVAVHMPVLKRDKDFQSQNSSKSLRQKGTISQVKNIFSFLTILNIWKVEIKLGNVCQLELIEKNSNRILMEICNICITFFF